MYTYYLIQKLIQNPILNCQKINYTLTLTLTINKLEKDNKQHEKQTKNYLH